MLNKQEKISILLQDCKAFLEQIKLLADDLENNDLSNSDVRAINCKICKCINDEILTIIESLDLRGGDDYEVINRGATSLCYQSIDDTQPKFILKVFEPNGFPLTPITPYSDIVHGVVVSYNWIDCSKVDTEQELSYLKRFIRFIMQEELIKSLQTSANKEKQNLFIVPELTLTTKGFAFVTPHFWGDTLKERFQKYAETTTSTTEEMICDSVMAVRQAAEYIRDVCHLKNIYHGDIKPSNFFDIEDGAAHLIKNIDFDTLVDFSDDSFCGYKNWDVAATTPFFYYADIERVIRNQDFDKIKEYDISALSRMLMYAIICIYGEEENLNKVFNNDSNHFNWIDFFFESSGVGERLFNDICIMNSADDGNYSERIKLSGLFIFEKIRSILMRCSEKVKDTARIIDVQEFIDCSSLIQELFKHNKNDFSIPSDKGKEQSYILNEVMRHLNLLYLDNENIRSNIRIVADYHRLIDLRPSLDWVQYVIEKNYYKQGKDDYDAVDRHLIPDIDLGDNNRLAYKFDDNGRPISKSPLEQALDLYKVDNTSLFLTAEGGQGKTTTLRSFWFDFLSGKHDMPCLYIDCKLLGTENHAIENYIGKEYGLSIENIGQDNKPIILLDGANESNAALRDKNDSGSCSLVLECQKLVKNGRIVLGSRSNIITTLKKEEEKNEVKEFDDYMQDATVCELRGDQIEYVLEKEKFTDIKAKQHVIRLLRNNMMLRIYRELIVSGGKVDEKDMKSGRLLDMYFNRCFKARYFKHVCALNDDEKSICELIDKAESEEYNENDDNVVTAIHNYLEHYSKIISYLMNNAAEMSFAVDELYKTISFVVLCELSLLKKTEDGNYTWANEIYQEYFQAKMIEGVLNRLHDDIFISCEVEHKGNRYRLDEINKLLDLHKFKKYNSLLFAGELLKTNIEYFIKIINNARLKKKSACNDGFDDKHIDALINVITVISVLSGNGVPNNITNIGLCLFEDCDNLTEIDIPNGVTSIGRLAFCNCNNLSRVHVSCDVTSIDDYAFADCSQLTDIELPNSVSIIGDGVFEDCVCLESVKLSNNIIHCGASTFSGCHESLFQFENGVYYVDKWAIQFDNSVSSVVLRSGTVGILSGAFEDRNKLLSVKIPNSVTIIGDNAFHGCTELTNIDIPNSVTIIGDNAFHGCTELTNIDIPNSVTRIGYSAFYNCKNATKISIGSGIKYIEEIPSGYMVVDDGEEDPEIIIYDEWWYNEHSEPFCGCYPRTIVMPRRLYADFEKFFGHEDDGSAEVILTDG